MQMRFHPALVPYSVETQRGWQEEKQPGSPEKQKLLNSNNHWSLLISRQIIQDNLHGSTHTLCKEVWETIGFYFEFEIFFNSLLYLHL